MQRRAFVLGLGLTLALAAPVLAQDLVTAITSQLRDQGFGQIDVRRTLLGRTRIVAQSAEGQREIIVNPNTGEILRDLWQPASGLSPRSPLVDRRTDGAGNRASGSGSSGSGSSNSGSGSTSGSGSNSGSGSGSNSGSGGGDDRSDDDDDDDDSGGNDDDDSGSGGDDDND